VKIPFEKEKHVYKNDAFAELVKDAIRFFNGTPVQLLPPPTQFTGVGVYALYYIGRNPLYNVYSEKNRLEYRFPIYVGKAVPRGWRQARALIESTSESNELYSRLNQHKNSIKSVKDLEPEEFMCRFVIFEDTSSDMISTIESSLIKINKPLWNTILDGFGNHDPGNGRYNQAKSDWDIVHRGRNFAEKCKGKPNTLESIIPKIVAHLNLFQ
jgi:hypothetical protein